MRFGFFSTALPDELRGVGEASAVVDELLVRDPELHLVAVQQVELLEDLLAAAGGTLHR